MNPDYSNYLKKGKIKSNNALSGYLLEIGLLLLSSFLFALSFPSFLSDWGWGPLAFISIIPVFIVIHRSGWVRIFFYGAAYGYITYALFNYWAATFHPLAIVILPIVYAVWFLFVFPLLKLADSLFPKYGYVLQVFIWIGYEYLRTIGFMGYPYGIIGYSQYLFIPLLQIVSITGVWGVSFLVIIPSAYIGNALKNGTSGIIGFFREHRIDGIIYTALFIFTICYGFISLSGNNFKDAPLWKVALIQHNANTWEGGIKTFKRNLDILTTLSEKAVKENPDIVIWSETAFVPGIDWHTRHRFDRDSYELVKEFKEFMDNQTIPFITGNDDGQLERVEDGKMERVDYNAALLYYNGELKQTYRKLHLVPFIEHFPYKNIFPRFNQFLIDNKYHFWKKGNEYTVFNVNGIKFSTLICFEDVFGYLSRNFVKKGADVIVNITNDSWSGSVAAEMQHMGISVFRAVENRRSLVRSTNSGITCTVTPDGRIANMLEPFTQDYIVAEVPVYDKETTFYTSRGDWVAILSIVVSCVLFAVGMGRWMIFKRKNQLTRT